MLLLFMLQKVIFFFIALTLILGSYIVIRKSYKNTNQLLSLLNQPAPTENPLLYRTIVGKVTGKTDGGFTITTSSKTYTFRISPVTQFFTFSGKGKATADDIRQNTYVRVTYPIAEEKSNPIATTGIFANIPETMVNPIEGTISQFESDKFILLTTTGRLTILVDKQTRWEGEGKAQVKQNFIYTGAKVKVFAVPIASLSAYLARGIIVDFSK